MCVRTGIFLCPTPAPGTINRVRREYIFFVCGYSRALHANLCMYEYGLPNTVQELTTNTAYVHSTVATTTAAPDTGSMFRYPFNFAAVVCCCSHIDSQYNAAGQAPITPEWKKYLGSKNRGKKQKTSIRTPRTPPLRTPLFYTGITHSLEGSNKAPNGGLRH